jgi:hypothetical protein
MTRLASRARALTILALAVGLAHPLPAGAAPVAFNHRMETAAACDPSLGHLRLRMDVFGAFGIATSQGDSAFFDPARDVPDRRAQGTVYESMGFLCTDAGGTREGHVFEAADMVGARVVADGVENRLTSTFDAGDVRVDLVATLDCNVVRQCWQFTNLGAAPLDTVAFYPYLDGDLLFEAGSDNDRGARALGEPPHLYEFDQGDAPARPTTYLGLYTDPDERRITGWEVGGFSESRTRLESVARGCPQLHRGLRDRDLRDVDVNRDLITDRGDDFTLALRADVGPLAPGATSEALCVYTQWGFGLPCGDADGDGICDAADACPFDAEGQPCETGAFGLCGAGATACEGGQVVCRPLLEPAPSDARCDGLDEDCDGAVDEDALDGQACQTGRPGICAAGRTVCADGGLRCDGPAPGLEVCNGLDDDCDGVVDDAPGDAGGACDSGLPGLCGPGREVCRAGALVCDPEAVPAANDATCDGLDEDCDGQVDEDAAALDAPCRADAAGVCADGRTLCVAGEVVCAPAAPGDEVCNGLDDDCDGAVDDAPADVGGACVGDRPGVCAPGLVACVAGAPVCEPLSAPAADDDTCDGIDEDCDGRIDEDARAGEACDTGLAGVCAGGLRVCVGGRIACEGPAPVEEICNGLDDDCDGAMDEAPIDAGGACDTGRPGLCAAGTVTCSDGVLTCVPSAEPAASDDTCDGLDEDCDGTVDDDVPVGEGGPCETGTVGVCAAGLRVCVDGAWACVPQVEPSAEVCNALDDDCDGETDESPEDGLLCATGGVGDCAAGRRRCADADMTCVPEDRPAEETCDGRDDNCDGTIDEGLRNACGACGPNAAEVCDGLDQDCDGRVDEDATCPDDARCLFGACAPPCVNFECPDALVCVDGFCIPDCGRAGCLDPESPYGGLCGAVACAEGFFCRAGACVESCARRSCALYELCLDGQCVPDACGGVVCADGEACDAGRCVPDPCAGVDCPDGERCERGACAADPCADAVCPPGQVCRVVQDTAQCAFDDGNGEPGHTPGDDAGPDSDQDAGPGGGDGGVDAEVRGLNLPPDTDAGGLSSAGPGDEKSPGPGADDCHCDVGGARPSGAPVPFLVAAALAGLGGVIRRRRQRHTEARHFIRSNWSRKA